MRATQDKFTETKYYLKKIKENLELIQKETKFTEIVDKIFEFRYALNAFVNNYRSTTFALQKEHKKNGELFADWYSRALKPIIEGEFTKVIQDLRNINQKEGNIYPTFEFKGSTQDTNIFFELDFTSNQDSFVTSYRMESIGMNSEKPVKANIADIQFKSTFPASGAVESIEISESDRQLIFKDAMNHLTKTVNSLYEQDGFKLNKIKIDRLNKEFTPEEFLDNLNRVTGTLQSILEDGWKIFGKKA